MVILYTIIGAFIGMVIGGILAIFAQLFYVMDIWYMSDLEIGSIFLIGVIVGATIGTFIGFRRMVAEKEAEIARKNAEGAQRQRMFWANETLQAAVSTNSICSHNNKEADKILVSATYKSDFQMINIMNELTKIVELQGKVDAIAEELSAREGNDLL